MMEKAGPGITEPRTEIRMVCALGWRLGKCDQLISDENFDQTWLIKNRSQGFQPMNI
jgi:hypothetical protein